jgi:CheY-like chemotaxis protein
MSRAGDADRAAPPMLEMMERQVSHLVRLVDDLLEMSRISRGALTLRKERVELAAIVRNAIETSEPLIESAGHSLRVSLPEQPLWLEGDAVRLAQIIANLLNNAARYTDDRGQILVRAERQRDTAVIAVLDSGIGIEPGTLPRVFEMFSRGAEAGRHGYGGLGIGLALSRRLAEMHGGTLDGRSEGPGKGSEFTLRLPLAAEPSDGADRMQATDEATEASIRPLRILVVDDNRDAAESLAMLLGSLGAKVHAAHSGPEALEKFAAHAPQVVFLDIGMPGMDGYEVARRIRSRHPDSRTTLVALTGWGQDEDRRKARAAGFDHHLVKPAEIDALQELLASVDDRLAV